MNKPRFRRSITQGREQAFGLGARTEKIFERYLFKRLDRLKSVRRFAFGWMLLIGLSIAGVLIQTYNLSGYYQTVQAVSGGTYREGILGTFSTANPLYATNNVDSTVTRLMFNGLYDYDADNKLVGDLADSIKVSPNGVIYTVKLKPNLKWHDGTPLTSADVLFTYQSIQNPDAQSPLRSSYQGITLAAPDVQTISFTLPSALASFPNTLTNGIVPKHLLEKTPPAELRTADFNTISPVGSGPFKWQAIQVSGSDPTKAQEQIALLPSESYHAGRPKLDRFVIHAFADRTELIEEFNDGSLSGLSGLSNVPDNLVKNTNLQSYNLMLTAGTYTFFKTTHPVLASQKVRQALVQGADQAAIIGQLSYPTKPVKGPLLGGQLANDGTLGQPKYDVVAAKAALDADGWVTGSDGFRKKGDQPLTFGLLATDSSEFKTVAKSLQKYWKDIGVKVNLRLLGPQDFQNALSFHDYDAVLYGISIGTDPDVFVYWDSTQVDIRSANRLNFSEYKNASADSALEAGRTRLDPALRTVKYKPFLQAWQTDLPALGLYQPRILYLTNGNIAGFEEQTINTSTDRFRNVHNWMIREAKVTNPR